MDKNISAKNKTLHLAFLGEDCGVYDISFVKHPAIGSNFIVKEDSDDVMIISAPILIANKVIQQFTKSIGEYSIMFTPDVIYDTMARYTSSLFSEKFTIEHSEVGINGISFIESYQVDYANGKRPPMGLVSVYDGSWVCKMSITNKNLSRLIREGEINGLSISGQFDYEEMPISDIVMFYNKFNF